GQEIKRLRVEAGMTARDFAVRVGKSVAYIGKIETQGEIPSPELVCQLAEVLGRDPELLLRIAKESYLSAAERELDRKFADALTAYRRTSKQATVEKTEENTKMATVVSLINMKGGVGKTTLASQLAHAADMDREYKVLAVDLDPQSNLSQTLMGAQKYVAHLKKGLPTVAQVFDEYVGPSPVGSAPRPLDLDEVIVKNVGYWS